MNKAWNIRLIGLGAAIGMLGVLADPFAPLASADALQLDRSAHSVPARIGGSCVPVEPSEMASIILVKGYGGGTLSSTTVVGQDRATEVTTIKIEVGQDPLYVLASSYLPMVWRIDGAVERVERFVVQSRAPYAGVVGLSAEKVAILDPGTCDGLNDEQGAIEETRNFSMRLLTDGKFVESYTLGRVSLPSGSVDELSIEHEDVGDLRALAQGADTTGSPRPVSVSVLNELLRLSPGGVVDVAPENVLSNGIAERYVVLPEEAGLVQLIQEGKLERVQRGFVVLKPIERFPGGLDGVHTVRFILPDDFPMPDGELGSSSVVRQSELDRNDAERRARQERLAEERGAKRAN